MCSSDLVFGPFGTDGKHLEQILEFANETDEIYESPGIYGENYVLHEKASGMLAYNPLYVSVTGLPLYNPDEYLNRVSIPAYNFGGQPVSIIANHGFAHDGCMSKCRIGTSSYYHFVVQTMAIDSLNVILWSIQGNATRLTSAFKYELGPVITFDSIYARFSVKTTTYGFPINNPWDPHKDYTLHDVLAEIGKKSSSSTSTTATTSQWFKGRNIQQPICSPSSLKRAVELRYAALKMEESPLELEPFGDLAMRASESVNANSVNMLEFLRDIGHPLDMIPKLSNLLKLRTHAGNYLAVQFGVLPTISDIQDIIGAFRKRKPYLDKCGFSVYNSSSSASASVKLHDFTLEQHLKLAIDDEDSDLDALTERLESWGILPTFENLWDLVPYSFVIDWLIDVGDLLRRVDTRMRLTRLNVRYVTMSVKRQTNKTFEWSAEFPYTGYIQSGYYYRWVSDQCPVPPTSLHASFLEFDHWIEALALLIQRRKSRPTWA